MNVEAVIALIAAALSGAALLLSVVERRAETRRALTDVTGWAEGHAKPPLVEITLRNGTTTALHNVQCSVWTRHKHDRPEIPHAFMPFPNVVPPLSTVSILLQAEMFTKNPKPHHVEYYVDLIFRDALGDWWVKQASGGLSKNRLPLRFEPPSELDQKAKPVYRWWQPMAWATKYGVFAAKRRSAKQRTGKPES